MIIHDLHDHRISHFTVLAVFFDHVGFCSEQCAQNFPTLEMTDNSRALPKGVQMLVPAYHFNCSGTIREWGVILERRILSRIDFQVWRQSNGERSRYQIVGANTVTNLRVRPNRKMVLSVPDQRRIRVKPGDVVGVYIGREGDTKIKYTPSRSVVTYFTRADRPLREFVIRNPVDSQSLHKSPLISAAVESSKLLVR